MLNNAYLLAKIGADTAENERNVAKILPKICKKLATTLPYPTRGPSARCAARSAHLVLREAREHVQDVLHLEAVRHLRGE